MWIMTPDGILMPAAVPKTVGPWNGDETHPLGWDQQVRARDRKVLIKLRRRMLAEHMSVSDVIATPNLDYDYRMYVLAEDFGYVVNQMVIEIDYEKFKPVSLEKSRGGKKLHAVYNRIWGIVADAYDSPILYRYNSRRGQR